MGLNKNPDLPQDFSGNVEHGVHALRIGLPEHPRFLCGEIPVGIGNDLPDRVEGAIEADIEAADGGCEGGDLEAGVGDGDADIVKAARAVFIEDGDVHVVGAGRAVEVAEDEALGWATLGLDSQAGVGTIKP